MSSFLHGPSSSKPSPPSRSPRNCSKPRKSNKAPRRATFRIAGCECAPGSGSDLLVEAEVLFDSGDADFKLEAFVEIGREVFLDDGEIARVVIENLRVIGERG